jgi:hypothetical protein
MQNAETILGIIRDRPVTTPSMPDGRCDSRSRPESLESRVRGKLASAVRREADGKGPGNRDLASGLPDFERGGRRQRRSRLLAHYARRESPT